MNKVITRIILSVSISAVFGFVGCGGPEGDGSPESHTAAESASKKETIPPKWVTIKGLYMGMKSEDFEKQINILAEQNNGKVKFDTDFDCYNVHAVDYGWTILANVKNGKLVRVKFEHDALEKLFNATRMSMKEFAQAICNNYGIANMKFYRDANFRGYKYEDAEGRGVSVLTDLHGRESLFWLEMTFMPRAFD